MIEHVCDRCARCTDEAKTEVVYRPKYDSYLGRHPTSEVLPSLANMWELIPPVFASPVPPLSAENDHVILSV